MTLFPERQAALKVLYEAAGRLLDNTADVELAISRQLNIIKAQSCLNLAGTIGKMDPVIIHIKGGVIERVEGTPFDLGYVVRNHDTMNRSEKLVDSDFEVKDD